MEYEINFEDEEEIYISVDSIVDDDLTVYLPDGTQQTTALRALDLEQAAMKHLRAFVLHSRDAGTSVE